MFTSTERKQIYIVTENQKVLYIKQEIFKLLPKWLNVVAKTIILTKIITICMVHK